jgi:hypothetical protein
MKKDKSCLSIIFLAVLKFSHNQMEGIKTTAFKSNAKNGGSKGRSSQ